MKALKFDFENIGGCTSLFAIPPESLLRIRRDYVDNLNYIECRQYDRIIEIPIYADGTFVWTEKLSVEDAGDGYAIEIAGIIPKNTLSNASDIEILERGEWYVLCQDNNGEVHFSGDEDALLKFTTEKTTGAVAADRNQIAFKFTCLQPNPSVYITIEDMSRL